MDAQELLYTTWGKAPDKQDIRAIRRFNDVLRKLAGAGEVLAFVLAIASVAAFLWFLFYGNFEIAIFTDGTSFTCLFDGSNKDIVNGNK